VVLRFGEAEERVSGGSNSTEATLNMPHATSDEMGRDFDEGDAIQRYLQGQGPEGGANDFGDREIDQTNKADDAIDYEDISDEDDLPDEEEATNREDAEGTNGFGDSEELPHTNGYHNAQPQSDDMYGEDFNDLFGEGMSSPVQERQPPPQTQTQPQSRPGGLALPSKTGLALPGYAGTYQQAQKAPHVRPHQPQYTPESLSPPSFHDDGYSPSAAESEVEDEDEGETDEVLLMQRRLFRQAKAKQFGQGVPEEHEDVDMDMFYTFFPGYEKEQNPRFIEFFPSRAVQYRGKVPPKPPKPVQPTKLSLDLLPDQERTFRSAAPPKTAKDLGYGSNVVFYPEQATAGYESDDDLGLAAEDNASVAGMRLEDFALVCEDWDVHSVDFVSALDEEDAPMDGEYEVEELLRPNKKRKTNILDSEMAVYDRELQLAFDDPERAVAKLAKAPLLDLNDPYLLIDEHAPQTVRKAKRMPGDIRRDPALTRDLAKRYNISNDEAYDLLKENHQHKIRSTLGGTSIEHSLPATKLQYPFYKVGLDPKAKRSFHRPALDLRLRMQKEEFRMGRLKTIKRKERKGKDVKELFATAESLSLNDNSSMLLLEYSEEAPVMLSNFGMGNRLVNFYRKRNADDQERPKREIGETSVLLTQDKSPFGIFGHVDQGEVVPTVQNGLYRAPVFQHQYKPTDFFVAISTTHGYGSRMYLRNMENLHSVGQQFPVVEIPGEHSRRVTDAAKKRLRALAYRIHLKASDLTRKPARHLDNAAIMEHLKGHDMPQTRSKMREFMKYLKDSKDGLGVWVPMPGVVVPDSETLRSWVKPEDVCALDSMQMGVQRLHDLGLTEAKGTGKEGEDDKDVDETANIEVQLAPWRATKNFMLANQGKSMLKLHGEGDPTGRGEGYSFVKISMKGKFDLPGESIDEKINAKTRKETGGHGYNVAAQAKKYDDYIRTLWERQKHSLSSNIEVSDTEMDDDIDMEPENAYARAGRAATPRSSFVGTPGGFGRRDDETGTQFSRASDRGHEKVLVIKRTGGRDAYGNPDDNSEEIRNPRVIREYKRRRNERLLENIEFVLPLFNSFTYQLARLTKTVASTPTYRIRRIRS